LAGFEEGLSANSRIAVNFARVDIVAGNRKHYVLIIAFGSSTTYAYWAFAVLGAILDTLFGGHHRIHCTNLAQLRDGWQSRDGKPVLLTTDRPDVQLSELLCTISAPRFAFMDDLEDSIVHAHAVDGMELQKAIRFTLSYFCTLSELLGTTLNFFPHPRSKTVREFVEEVAAAVPGADGAILERVLEILIPEGTVKRDISVVDLINSQRNAVRFPGWYPESMAAEEQEMVKEISREYRPLVSERRLSRLQWPVRMFFSPDTAHFQARIDLTGRARHIMYGPYLFLPRGDWRSEVEFEVADNISGTEIEADVCVGFNRVTSGQVALPALGIFKFHMDFSVVDPDLPIEIRIALLRSAIEGALRLNSITLTLLDEVEATAHLGPVDSKLMLPQT
jgi:hypothetical protein